MTYEELVQIYSEEGLQQIFLQTKHRNYLWQIAMPKSGSTWLTKILSQLYTNEGWEVSALVPYYGKRNQEIDPRYFFTKGGINANVFFSQQHCVFSEYTNYLVRQSNTKCIFQVRNLFDVTVSIFDHFKKAIESNHADIEALPCSYKNWDDEQLMEYIIDIEIPWFVKFIEGWYQSSLMRDGHLIKVNYEDLLLNTEDCINRIILSAGLTVKHTKIKDILIATTGENTRKNKGKVGRGKEILNSKQIDRIFLLASYCNLTKDFELLSIN